MAVTAGCGRSPELPSGVPHGTGIQGPSSAVFPDIPAGAGWGAGQPGLKLEPIRDDSDLKVLPYQPPKATILTCD